MLDRADSSGAPQPGAYERFIASMVMDLDKWRDGIGYDLRALGEMTADERESVRTMLKGRSDWRDAEALAALDPPDLEALRHRFGDPDATFSARLRAGDELDARGVRVDFVPLVMAMLDAGAAGDVTALSRVIDWLEWRNPDVDDRLKRHLLRLLIKTCSPFATNLAAIVCVVHGLSTSVNDWTDRPFWLRFAEPEEHERAVDELLTRIGVSRAALHDCKG